MKKIINKPENYVDEMLEGLYAAHPDYITYTADDWKGWHRYRWWFGTFAIIPGICWKRHAGWLLCRRCVPVTKSGTGI